MIATPRTRTKQDPRLLTPADHARNIAAIPLLTAAGVLLIFAASFFNLVNIEVDKDDVALDMQVKLKLLICAACGLYGLLGLFTDLRVKKVLLTFPGAWITVICGFYCLSVLTSLDPTFSLGSVISLVCVVLATVTAVTQIGILPILNTIFYAICLFLIGSWIAYFKYPEIGVFAEPIAGGQFVERMSGLAHSNTLGQYSALAIVLGVVLWRYYGFRSSFRAIMIGLAFAALVLSVSRASMLAGMAGLCVAFSSKVFRKELLSYYFLFAALALFGIMLAFLLFDMEAFIEAKLASASKSGDSDELTTATGRAEIWAKSIELILERPLTGWGAATSKYLLADYSLYTHNLVLNVALSTGLLGGVAALGMMLTRLASTLRRHHPVADALFVFLFVNGLVENVAFSLLAGMPTIMLVITLMWWSWESDPALDIESSKELTTT